MPKKKGGDKGGNKKQEKKVEKIVEDKTFGLKNKINQQQLKKK